MEKIAHFVERFPVAGNDYIYNQLLNTNNIKSLLIAEWLIKKRNSQDFAPFYFKNYSHLTLFKLINNRLNVEIFNKLYIKSFNSYAQKIILDNQASIMHAHFATEGYKLINLRKKLGIPLVVTFYGVDASYCLRNKRWIDRFKGLFEFADILIVLCEEVKQKLLNLGCSGEKIKIWDIGIDLNEFKFKKKLPKKEIKFLIVARFVEKKGYFILLQALKKILGIHQNVNLTIIGYGPLKEKLLSEIEKLGIKHFVKLIDTAKVDNFSQLFKESLAEHDIFILPSIVARNGDDEGGPPVVIANAQACGLPVISTPVGGITRAITDNETGFLSRPGDIDDLVEKMNFLIKNPEVRSLIAIKARSFVEKAFSLHEQLKKLEQIYLSLSN